MRMARLLSLGLGLGTIAAVASAQCGPFFANPAVVASLPSVPRDLVAADLNRDGIPDLVCATTQSNAPHGIAVMRTNASGVPEVRQFLTLSGIQSAIKLAVADVNRDGIVDLLVTQVTTSSLLVYLGVGDGTFNPSPAAFAVGNAPSDLEVADLNNDGRIDVVVANPTVSTYSVLMGNGDGTFQPRVATAAGVSSSNLLSLADANGDGKLDLILSGSVGAVAVRLGNGNGTFSTATVYNSAPGTTSANKMIVRDVTADGVPDVLRISASAESILVRKGRANGTLEAEQALGMSLPGVVLRTFALSDFNSDGKVDLSLIYSDAGGFVSFTAIGLGNGNGTFAAPMTWPEVTPSGSNCLTTVADLNSDLRPDMIYVENAGRVITSLSNSAGIKLVSGLSNAVYTAGTNALASVLAEGTSLQYEWSKNGTPLMNTARVSTDGRFLQFNNLNDSDSGVYQCRIFNACNSITTTSYVHVLPPSNPCPVDFDGDGFITFEDFDAFIAVFEEGC